MGARLLDAELAAHQTDLDQIPAERLTAYLADANLAEIDALLADIGLGNRLPPWWPGGSWPGEGEAPAPPQAADPHPTACDPGHRGHGGDLRALLPPHPRRRHRRPVQPGQGARGPSPGVPQPRQPPRPSATSGWTWSGRSDPDGDFTSTIRVEVGNRRGTLAIVAAAIAEQGSNIENVQSRERDGMTSTLEFMLSVRSRHHLAHIMRRLRRLAQVERIVRLVH